jgi:PD-(D/E)XK endonuclease
MGLFGPKRNKKALGERSQAIIIYRLLEAGYNILTPYGDNTRYDLVIEDADGQFWRVQCKTAWLEPDGNTIRFAVYSPDTDKVYLVPINHVGKTEMKLRLVAPKNSNQWGVKMAPDYELE